MTRPAHWSEPLVRSDGVRLGGYSTGWKIYSADNEMVVDECPCCGTRMWTATNVRRVADYLFPPHPTLDAAATLAEQISQEELRKCPD